MIETPRLSALRTIKTEASGLADLVHALEGSLGLAFGEACALINRISGRVIVAGVGKSGHIGGKLAATLASTGTSAFFVHPAEANHGDLGMIAHDDVVIALSWSGETAELKGIINYVSRFSIPLIAITSNRNSTLGREAAICLELPRITEACPNGLAPTTSTIIQMAMGDALAVALLEARGFSAEDFSVYHPGGSLGSNLTRIGEIMHKDSAVPLVDLRTRMQDAIIELSKKGFGCVGVVDEKKKLVGIFTDGDLARNLNQNLYASVVDDFMTLDPITISADALASTALATLNSNNISALIVTSHNTCPLGIIHLHDLLRIGVA